jgi:hypothetical protein
MQSLDCVEFARNRANVLFVSGVDAIAPLARLAVEILPTREGSAREKVILDEVERPLHTR